MTRAGLHFAEGREEEGKPSCAVYFCLHGHIPLGNTLTSPGKSLSNALSFVIALGIRYVCPDAAGAFFSLYLSRHFRLLVDTRDP